MNDICKAVFAISLFVVGNAQANVITADVSALGFVGSPGLPSPDSKAWNFSESGGTAQLNFELVGYHSIDGWVGDGSSGTSTDIFTLSVNGNEIFSGSFNMGGRDARGYESSHIIYNSNNAVYLVTDYGIGAGGFTDISVPIDLQGSGHQTITFAYSSSTPEQLANEGWGVNWAYVTTPVPEPEEWGMMLLGFGLVGWQIKRKHRKASPAAV